MTTHGIVYAAQPYIGPKLGSGGYSCRRGWQLVALDSVTGKRRRAFGNKFTLKLDGFPYHYKSGFSKARKAMYDQQEIEIKLLEKQYNNK